MNNHVRLGGICQPLGPLQKQTCHLPEETGVQLLCAVSYDKGAETWTLTKQAHNKHVAAQTKMERNMLNIIYTCCMTRQVDKGDQPSGGETTWTNTGGTRSGRGQHKIGYLGGGILRDNYGILRLANDDDYYCSTFCHLTLHWGNAQVDD